MSGTSAAVMDNHGHEPWMADEQWSTADPAAVPALSRFELSPMMEYEWILLIANITIMISSLVGNVCVIYFLCSHAKARTAHNITVVSIAVSDILVACFVMPTYLAVAMYQASSGGDELTPHLCKLQAYVWYWCKTVAVYSILAMVCDRYTRAAQPKKRHLVTGRYMFFLSFLWFFGAAYNVWQLVLKSSAYIGVQTEAGQNVTVRACFSLGPYRQLESGFIVTDFIVIFAIPGSVIGFMFGRMVVFACTDKTRQNRFPSRRRLLLSVCLFILFLLCQLPFEIMDTQMYFYLDVSHWSVALSKLLDTIAFSQGALNVVAYFCCSPELHKSVREWFAHKRQAQKAAAAAGAEFQTSALIAALAPKKPLQRSSSNQDVRALGLMTEFLSMRGGRYPLPEPT